MSVIIEINLETDLSEFTSTVTDSGDLAWSNDATAQAVAGTSGAMSCLIDDTTAIYGQKSVSENTSGKLRARFYVDPNTLTMANNNRFLLLFAFSSATYICNVDLSYATGVGYRTSITIYNDAGAGSYSADYAITDAPHYIEMYLIRSTNATSNDGSMALWVDGTLKETITGIDNYDRFNNFNIVQLGAVSSIDSGTSGTFYLDELVVNDDGSEIGPVSSDTPLTVADSSHAHAAEAPALNVSAALVVDDVAHAHAGDGVVLTAVIYLIVADALHAHAAEQVTFPGATTGGTGTRRGMKLGIEREMVTND